MEGLPIFIVVAVVFGVLAIWAYQRGKKRQAKLAAWAHARNWEYAKTDKSLVKRWDSAPFSRGRGNNPQATSVMWGPSAAPNGQVRQALSFSFVYTINSGMGENQTETTYRQHVTCVFVDLSTPNLEITRERFSSKFSKIFGRQDIQFEFEEFNKAWCIQAVNLKFAHDVLHPRMMEYVMTLTRSGLSMVLPGDCVMVFNRDAFDVRAVDPMLAVRHQIIDRIPAYVYQDFA